MRDAVLKIVEEVLPEKGELSEEQISQVASRNPGIAAHLRRIAGALGFEASRLESWEEPTVTRLPSMAETVLDAVAQPVIAVANGEGGPQSWN